MTHHAVPEGIDVAFTFLGRDEELAKELARLLRPSVNTFVYSEHQKDLAGTDGVATFTDIYQKQARYVVVLYRTGYGETKWTRIEQTAVTSRAVVMGWTSLLLISLDGTIPKWVPASQLWYSIKEFGVRAAADAILGRFRELGQEGRPRSLVEYARGLSQQLASKEEADEWVQSRASVDAAAAEVSRLKRVFGEQIAAIKEAAPNVNLSNIPADHNGLFGIRAGGNRATFVWVNSYGNTTKYGYLYVRETEIVTDHKSDRTDVPTREVHMTLSGPAPRLWTASEEPGRSFTTEELADWHIRKLLPER